MLFFVCEITYVHKFRVHINRNDKNNSESSFHFVEEYMEHVDDWFDTYYRNKNVEKRIYLATNDPTIADYLMYEKSLWRWRRV